MFTSTRRAAVRSAVTLMALLAMTLVGAAGPATPAQASSHSVSAVAPIDTTWIDLGVTLTQTTHPTGGAVMLWNRSGDTVSPRLVGYLSMSGAAGYCGSVRLRYYQGLTQVAEEYSLPLCTAGNGLVGQAVFAGTQNNLLITGVSVEVGLDPWIFPGSWQPIQTAYVYA